MYFSGIPQNPIVKGTDNFITQFEKFDELLMLADKIKSTTSALNHILDNVILIAQPAILKKSAMRLRV